jgi:plastocyanin
LAAKTKSDHAGLMRPRPVLLCIAIAFALVAAAPAGAATRHITLRTGPYTVQGFQTIWPNVAVRNTGVDGYITRMDAALVDRRGHAVRINKVMLHHVVFIDSGRRYNACRGRKGTPFFGTGEENEQLVLPPGYGYRTHRGDDWRMVAMFMSHQLQAKTVYLRYRVTVITGPPARRMTDVLPMWLRADGCKVEPAYDVNGDGDPAQHNLQTAAWRMPVDGRIVAAGGHLHGGAYDLRVTQPRCGDRTLIHNAPRYGEPSDLVYHVFPVLHEPGPISTGWQLSKAGIPVRKGELLNVTGDYDQSEPHGRVMAITHLYVARDSNVPAGCPRLPSDIRTVWSRPRGRSLPPRVTIPLSRLNSRGRVVSVDRPPGDEVVSDTPDTAVGTTLQAFAPANLSIPTGASVTWRFDDDYAHNVSLASGPRGVYSPNFHQGATYTHQFTVPGTYKLFCYLHPLTMNQVVTVRP